MKDNFSAQSSRYAQFRPVYPKEMFDFIFRHAPSFDCAWDCGTGNGQVASVLAGRFARVEATDISRNQIDHAVQMPNINYRVQAVEEAGFPAGYFDLITVAQAVHWFDFDKFFRVVNHCLKPDGILVLIGYSLFRTFSPLDEVIDHFYHNIVGSFWDPERQHVDNAYRTIPFPFREIEVPEIAMKYQWSKEQFTGYLGTWSAVQHYGAHHDCDPVDLIKDDIDQNWPPDELITVQFPLILRVGRKM